ncbi:MAG: hypothetical protein AB7R89_01495 [Dehalococcoidia bacterium]
MRRLATPPAWQPLVSLLALSLPLLLLLALYYRFDGTPHFFLHTLTGWNIGLVRLLAATYYGQRWSYWDGLLPLGLALWALTPDSIYIAGPYHRDWMDLFLFHVALDEILPVALVVLTALWLVLIVGYARF